MGMSGNVKWLPALLNQKGQSLVELSILMTILIILLSGLADFGRAYLIFLELREAAQEGAAYGSFTPTDFSGIEARVREIIIQPFDLSDPAIVKVVPALSNPSQACSGFHPTTLTSNEIKVTIIYQMPISMPFLGAILGRQDIPIVVTVSNAILKPPCS
jgi:Flp pilus assembly protein TadG